MISEVYLIHQIQTTIMTKFRRPFRCAENMTNFYNMTNFCKLRNDDVNHFAPLKSLKLLQPSVIEISRVVPFSSLPPSSPLSRCGVLKTPPLRRLISTRLVCCSLRTALVVCYIDPLVHTHITLPLTPLVTFVCPLHYHYSIAHTHTLQR